MRKRSEIQQAALDVPPLKANHEALFPAEKYEPKTSTVVDLGKAIAEESAKREFRTEGLKVVSHHGGPHLSADFERIVERVFDLPDPLAQYDRLESALKLGDARTDHGSIQKALDEAEDNARMAHKLWCNAKVEEVAFEKEFEVLQAPWLAEAHAKLQDEKDKGSRNKAITDGDVRAKAAELFPDEYRGSEVRKARVKYMVKQTEKLTELWTQRCSTLQTMQSNRRR